MSSNLWVKQGIYDPTKRFSFTNITDKPFSFSWGGTPIVIKAGETVELRHHLAVLATTKLVDQIMQGEIKDEEEKMKLETKNPYYRSPRAISMGVPAAREPYEKKILKELPPKNDSDAQLQVIRSEIKEELVRDLKQENSPAISKTSDLGVTATEFEEINMPHKAI